MTSLLLEESYSEEDQELFKEIKEYWSNFWQINKKLPFKERDQKRKQNEDIFNRQFSQDKKNRVVEILEDIANNLIGSTIEFRINNEWKSYKIAMVEIYADGIWDEAGDFIKQIYRSQNTLAETKLYSGPRLYFFNGRLDIKAFGEFMPFSFLIRNYIDGNNKLLADETWGSCYKFDFYSDVNQLLKQIRKRDEAILSNETCPVRLNFRDKNETIRIDQEGRVCNRHHVGERQWNFRWIMEE